MKIILLILFIVGSVKAIQAQNIVALEYFIDVDAGVGKNHLVSVAPESDGDFAALVDVSGVLPGNHFLYMRTLDDKGYWGLTSKRNIEVLPTQSQNIIVKGEYFFDVDPGIGVANGLPVASPDSAITQNFNLATSTLAAGRHFLYERFIDSYGRWGQTQGRSVEVIKNPDSSSIVAIEYFYTTDSGYGKGNLIRLPVASQDGNFTFSIPAEKRALGINNLFIRAVDSSNNLWSLTTFKIDTNLIITPLTLLNFNAEKINSLVELKWQTENEFNTLLFNIQRSVDGVIYNDIGKVIAKGNSVARSSYGYTDNTSNRASKQLYYRLKQVDKDGAFTYSNVVKLNINNNKLGFDMFPNPASDYFIITPGGNTFFENATLIITDVAGHTIIKQKITNSGSKKISLSSFAKGLYLVSIVNKDFLQTEKLIIK